MNMENGIVAISAVIITVIIRIITTRALIGKKGQKGRKMRLIDADALIEEYRKIQWDDYPSEYRAIVDAIIKDIEEAAIESEVKSKDIAEVFTGEHAEEYYGLEAICGSCGTAWEGTGDDNFCPNCGKQLIDKGRCINEKDTDIVC